MKMIYMLLAALVLLPAAHALVVLPANTTYEYNYTNSTNETSNESFYCAYPLDTAWCPAPANITLQASLLPGETRVFGQQYCSVTATCAATNPTNNPGCNIDTSINPGETYQRVDSACNVVVKAKNPSNIANGTTDIKKYSQDVTFTYNGSVITYITENKTFSFDADGTNFTKSYKVDFFCPAAEPMLPKTEQDYKDLLSVCNKFVPFLVKDYITPTLDYCRASIQFHVDDVKNFSNEKMALIEENAAQKSQIAAMDAQLNATTTAAETARGERDDWHNKYDDQNLSFRMLLAWAVVTTLCAGFFLYSLVRRNE